MQIGKGRPLACFCWILALMAAVFAVCDPSVTVLLISLLVAFSLFAVLLILGLLLPRGRGHIRYLSFLAVAILLSTGLAYARKAVILQPAQDYARGESAVTITGVVISEEYYSDYLSCVGVKMELPQTEGGAASLYLNLTGSHDIRIGDYFVATGTVYTIEDAPEEPYDLRRLRADGYVLVGYVESIEDIETLSRDEFVLRRELGRLQYRLADKLSAAVGGESGDLCAALLLGMREDLSGSTTLDFRRAGASHLLALSGLHLSLILLALGALLKALRCPYYLRLLLSAAMAILFLALTGCSVSLLRATFMLLCLYLSRLRGIPHDTLTPLSVFLGVTLTISPHAIYDAGLWLTVLATFALIEVVPGLLRQTATQPAMGRGRRLLHSLWKNLLYPLLASVIILYVLLIPMAIIFGEISLLSPLSNLLLTPLTALCLVLGLCYFALSCLGLLCPPLLAVAAWVAQGLYHIASAMLSITAYLSDLPRGMLSLRYDFVLPLLCVLAMALLLFLILRWRHPRRFWAVLAAWSGAFVLCLSLTRTGTEGKWLLEYRADRDNELLCLSQNETAILCDVTDGSFGTYRHLMSEGLPVGTTEVEAVVLTHYHSLHISTVQKLLDRVKVRTLWLPLTMPDTDPEVALRDEGRMRTIAVLAESRRVKVHYYLPTEGAALTPTLRLDRLYYAMLDRSTHPTISMSWQYQNTADTEEKQFLWLGASAWESAASEEILAEATASHVLLFAKHGPVIKSEYALESFTITPELWLFADGNTALPLRPTPEAAQIIKDMTDVFCNGYRKTALP